MLWSEGSESIFQNVLLYENKPRNIWDRLPKWQPKEQTCIQGIVIGLKLHPRPGAGSTSVPGKQLGRLSAVWHFGKRCFLSIVFHGRRFVFSFSQQLRGAGGIPVTANDISSKDKATAAGRSSHRLLWIITEKAKH